MTINHPIELPSNEPTSQPKPVSMARTAVITIAICLAVVGLLSALITYYIPVS